MPYGSVFVRGPSNKQVYLNGNYAQSAGETNTDFMVEYGSNTFETLDENRNVELRAKITVDNDNKNPEVELKPIE